MAKMGRPKSDDPMNYRFTIRFSNAEQKQLEAYQITAVDLALHPVAQALDTLDVLVGSVQRCHLGHARFQQQARSPDPVPVRSCPARCAGSVGPKGPWQS